MVFGVSQNTLAIWGSNIRAQRERLGLSREALARRIGVSPPTIWRWETGKSAPTITHMYALAAEFDVTPGDLFPLGLEHD